MRRHESSKEKRLRDLRHAERDASEQWLARTGRVYEHGPDTGYEVIDFEKRHRMESELEAIQREIRQIEQEP